MRLMTTDEFSSHLIDPFQKIATCNLRILINIIWLYIHIPTQPHIYTHIHKRHTDRHRDIDTET